MVIMTSLDSDTSSGDRFVGIPSSENFFMASSLLNIIDSVFVGWSNNSFKMTTELRVRLSYLPCVTYIISKQTTFEQGIIG